MQSYSPDLRDRVLWALERGERPTAIAQRLEVSRVWVYQVRGRERKTGQRTALQIGVTAPMVADGRRSAGFEVGNFRWEEGDLKTEISDLHGRDCLGRKSGWGGAC